MAFVSRRDFLFQAGGGLSGVALAQMLHADNPYAVKTSHHPARAKAVISLFMSGGVSQVDTFDPKPLLAKYAGKPLEGKGDIVVRQGHPGPLMPSPFQFKKYGESGMEISELFPHVARHADSLAVIRSLK